MGGQNAQQNVLLMTGVLYKDPDWPKESVKTSPYILRQLHRQCCHLNNVILPFIVLCQGRKIIAKYFAGTMRAQGASCFSKFHFFVFTFRF